MIMLVVTSFVIVLLFFFNVSIMMQGYMYCAILYHFRIYLEYVSYT